MPICHLVANEFSPTLGGLQDSVLRIALLINSMHGWTVRVYVRDENNRYAECGLQDLDVVQVGVERAQLMQPVRALTADRFRADFLIIRREIEQCLRQRPREVHIMLSFGVPQTGFIAQQVATAVGLAHVSCFRGTDFSRDCFDPYAHSGISHVVQRATAIVTTNAEQRRFLKASFGSKINVTTIYNGVEVPTTRWHANRKARLRLVADCGYAFKKGTHFLLQACERLWSEGFPIDLSLCGSTTPSEESYWNQVRSEFQSQYGLMVHFRDFIAKEMVEQMLLSGDLYCSATFGEGCSLARFKALMLGMPIVSTRCGELADFATHMSHVFLAPPGDAEAFSGTLKSACEQLLDETITVDADCVERSRQLLGLEAERTRWRQLLTSIAPASAKPSMPRQFRVLMYAHDGRGLGHLRRLCRLAKALQGTCAVLIVTGLRDASWLVPDSCEFLHIPSIDSLDPRLSIQWGRDPFWNAGRREGFRLRRAAVESVIDSYSPDAIVLDFLPAGKDDEMYDVLDQSSARRYLILRGVLDDLSGVQGYIFDQTGEYLIENCYDRILVMADPSIVDVVAEYRFNNAVADKVVYAGYAADPTTDAVREHTRSQRGLSQEARWVVCSAGGGKEGEDLVEYCHKLSGQLPNVYFDIVTGPRSRSSLEPTPAGCDPRVCVTRERRDLPLLHAACDVLICRGGYNSLMEAAVGRARVIVVPIRGDHEQFTHASRLAAFLPISVVTEVGELETFLHEELAAGPRSGNHCPLDFNGAEFAANLIIDDLRAMS